MNIDLAVILCLADKEKNKPFDDYVGGIVARMLENSPQEKAFLEQFDIHYYLADNPQDKSIARVVDADYADDMQSLQQGASFAVVLNKEVLQKLNSEDALAFVVGHEISHVMYQKGNHKTQDLAKNEESACDFSAITMMENGKFNLLEIAAVDNLYPQKTPEMQRRMMDREAFMAQNGYQAFARLGMESPLKKEIFMGLQKEPWRRKSIFTHDGIGVEQIAAELGDIYQNGDRDIFLREFDTFLKQKPTEEASKLVMSVLAEVMPKYGSIEEVAAKDGYKKYRRHPVAVMSNIVMSQFAREGKKLLPPKDLAIVNQYMQQNRTYFENKDKKFWEPLRNTMSQQSLTIGKSR